MLENLLHLKKKKMLWNFYFSLLVYVGNSPWYLRVSHEGRVLRNGISDSFLYNESFPYSGPS